MPKINVYLPDDLADAVKETGVPVSAVCQRALEQAVRRVTAIRETVRGDVPVAELPAMPAFTKRAQTALTLAIQQARALGSPAVGTAHLLGGLLGEGGNLALRILDVLEIEPGQVERALAGRRSGGPAGDGTPNDGEQGDRGAGDGGPGPAGKARFTDAAAAALELTTAEAIGLGHNYIGCEHLLLGLVIEPDGDAGQVLRSLGAEPRLTRRAITAALAGYVHLQTQGALKGPGPLPAQDLRPGPAGLPAAAAQALATAVRQELQPLAARIERIERRLELSPDA